MKTCTKCTLSLPLTDFNKSSRIKKDGLSSWCKSCHLTANKRWVKNNFAKKMDQQRTRRQGIAQAVRALKTQCTRCPENHPACLDFHHLDPNEKEINLADMVSQAWGWDRIMTEVNKCIVLCANCHRKEHYVP